MNHSDSDAESTNDIFLPVVRIEEDFPLSHSWISDALEADDDVSLPALDLVLNTLSQFLIQPSELLGSDGGDSQSSDTIDDLLREMFEP